MTPLNRDCDRIVADMIRLGATFEITNSGPNGEPRWTWSPAPGRRDDVRRFWLTVDRARMGFGAAMIDAIRRAHRVAVEEPVR